MFEIYYLEKRFTPQYVKGIKKISNVSIQFIDFKQKEDRIEHFDFNINHVYITK